MKLSDEQLAELLKHDPSEIRCWRCSFIADIARELLDSRKVVEAARKACAAKPGYRVHECLDLVLEDIIAYDKATNAARPQE